MSQKQSASTMYLHFSRIYSEMAKENKLAFRNYIIYLHLYKEKKPQKVMKWDENETFHWIMMMVKKLYRNYLQTIYIKNYYPPSPCFPFIYVSLWK